MNIAKTASGILKPKNNILRGTMDEQLSAGSRPFMHASEFVPDSSARRAGFFKPLSSLQPHKRSRPALLDHDDDDVVDLLTTKTQLSTPYAAPRTPAGLCDAPRGGKKGEICAVASEADECFDFLPMLPLDFTKQREGPAQLIPRPLKRKKMTAPLEQPPERDVLPVFSAKVPPGLVRPRLPSVPMLRPNALPRRKLQIRRQAIMPMPNVCFGGQFLSPPSSPSQSEFKLVNGLLR